MQKSLTIIALITALAALGLCIAGKSVSQSTAKKETASERVLRTRTLRCGYALWPVSEEIDPNTKEMKGIVPEFTKALGKKLGLKIEWVQEVLWDQQLEAFRSGKIDAVCAGDGPWTYTSAAVLDYTEPMAYIPIYFYGRKGESRFKNPAAANASNVTFSAIDGDISLAMAMENFPKARVLELPSSDDPSLILTNVSNGKADLVMVDPLTTDRFNQTNDKKLERLSDKPLAVINISFSLPKGEEDLQHMLDQGFRLLQGLGISDQILDRYDPERKLFYRPQKPWMAGN
jgi:ABC-type amino acid transport substrate-binding protein